MIKILFICHGNICRSPMAEFMMKDYVKKMGLEHQFYIESAATSTEEIWNGIGNPVYPPAREKLKEHGITCEGKRARQLTREDYQKFDFLLGMDRYNLSNMKRICGNDKEGKMHLLLEYGTRCRDISDPWYSGDFQTTYEDIYEGIVGLVDYCKKEGRLK